MVRLARRRRVDRPRSSAVVGGGPAVRRKAAEAQEEPLAPLPAEVEEGALTPLPHRPGPGRRRWRRWTLRILWWSARRHLKRCPHSPPPSCRPRSRSPRKQPVQKSQAPKAAQHLPSSPSGTKSEEQHRGCPATSPSSPPTWVEVALSPWASSSSPSSSPPAWFGWRRICNPGLLLQRLLGRGGWSRPDHTARCFLLGPPRPELRWNLPCPNPLLGLEELHLEHVLLCKENHVARPQRMACLY